MIWMRKHSCMFLEAIILVLDCLKVLNLINLSIPTGTKSWCYTCNNVQHLAYLWEHIGKHITDTLLLTACINLMIFQRMVVGLLTSVKSSEWSNSATFNFLKHTESMFSTSELLKSLKICLSCQKEPANWCARSCSSLLLIMLSSSSGRTGDTRRSLWHCSCVLLHVSWPMWLVWKKAVHSLAQEGLWGTLSLFFKAK